MTLTADAQVGAWTRTHCQRHAHRIGWADSYWMELFIFTLTRPLAIYCDKCENKNTARRTVVHSRRVLPDSVDAMLSGRCLPGLV